MMNEIFRLFGSIFVRNDEANRQIRQTGREANKLQSTMSTAFDKIGKAAVVGLGVATAAMGTLIVKSMNLAGELEQNMGGSKAVFGIFAHDMQMLAANAYKQMGLSQSEYLASANKMGSLFQGMGFSVTESVDMTAKAMQRAADVSSVMGISQEEAMEAIAGMAKGNFTMMDNLGVAMNDTALAAYAVEKGIGKSVSKMATNEKIALAYQMFMEKSAYAAGNYAKENETLAGSLSTAKAAWKNFLSASDTQNSEVMMRGLVDSFVNVGEVVTKNLTKIVPRLAKGLSTLMQRLTPYVPELLQALLPGLIDGVIALTTGLALALPDILEVLTEQLPYILDSIIASLDQILPALVVAITTMFASLMDNLPSILQKVGEVISKVWRNGVWPLIQNLFHAVFGVELPSWDDIVASISAGWAQIEESIRDWFKTTFGIELPEWSDVVAAIGTWWSNIMNTIGNAFTVLFGLEMSATDKNKKPWGDVIGAWFGDIMYAIGSVLLAPFGMKLPTFAEAILAIKNWWENDVIPNLPELAATVKVKLHFFYSNLLKGLQVAFDGDNTQVTRGEDGHVYVNGETNDVIDALSSPTIKELTDGKYGSIPGESSGLDFVPRNDMLARLHYGEAVLTRSEANAWRRGQNDGIDYDRLAEAMAARPMAFNIDGKAFAVMLAREMNRAIGNRNIQTLMAMGG